MTARFGVAAFVLLTSSVSAVSSGETKARHTVPGVPYIRQSHRNTCGAAALAMLLRYHGKRATEQDLLKAYPKMKQTGFYVPWLWQHSRKQGFKTTSGVGTADGIKKLLRSDTPVIVYQRSAPGRKRPHFRVVVGYDDERKVFVIWDPAPQLGKGHEVGYRTFEQLWQVPYYGTQSHFFFTITPRKPVPRLAAGTSALPAKPGEYSLPNEQGYRVKASSAISNTRPEMAIDGDLDTAWWGDACPQWCQIDLGAVRKVSELNIVFHYRDNRYYQYCVEAAQDEKKWQTIVDETRNADRSTPQGKTQTFNPPVLARYLRLTVTHDSADPCAHVQEIRVKAEGR